jgi:hypothetical protein
MFYYLCNAELFGWVYGNYSISLFFEGPAKP